MKRSRNQSDGVPSPGSEVADSSGKRRKPEAFSFREIQHSDGYDVMFFLTSCELLGIRLLDA